MAGCSMGITVNNSPLIFLPSMQRTPGLPKALYKEIKTGLQLPLGSKANLSLKGTRLAHCLVGNAVSYFLSKH